MPCSDSSSSIALRHDHQERFLSFEFAKITCGREITAQTDYNSYCKGKPLREILDIPFGEVVENLKAEGEEAQFILYLEWDALRSAIAQYLGIDDKDIDKNRCRISSIEHKDEDVEVVQVILPPAELPKILPCSLGDEH